ncbi:MAG: phosphotransferase [Meiothermus sp.]|nr:phosphotransferase [Meiothermus sp.]
MIEAVLLARVAALPCWSGRVEVGELEGGITNRNLLVQDARGRYVVRLGEDIPVHGIMRFNELAASHVAHAAGLSPRVVYAEQGLMVLEYLEARALTPEQVREPGRLSALVELLRRCHLEVPKHLRGPVLSFNVFHVLRNYGAWLIEHDSQYAAELTGLLERAARLEQLTGAVRLVWGHNDLLAANLLDDGRRLWLIDWDYGGFNTPLFDLGGLASNSGFGEALELELLSCYFGRAPGPDLLRRYRALKCASLLRETMWSMVSEQTSSLDFNYAAYTADNRRRFEGAWEQLKE